MKRWAIRFVELPDGYAYKMRLVRPFAGHYLKSYDPDAREGLGEAVFIADPTDALTFDSFDDARACWFGQSSVMPTVFERGREVENRPLAMLSVSIDPLP